VWGESNSSNKAGVYGKNTQVNGWGVRGVTTKNGGIGVYGTGLGNGTGVYGTENTGIGVLGSSNDGDGVYGLTNDAASAGVRALNGGTGPAVNALSGGIGVNALSTTNDGVVGTTWADYKSGVYGVSSLATGYGVTGHSDSYFGMFADGYDAGGFDLVGDLTWGVTLVRSLLLEITLISIPMGMLTLISITTTIVQIPVLPFGEVMIPSFSNGVKEASSHKLPRRLRYRPPAKANG
jgi:hypothetical protein